MNGEGKSSIGDAVSWTLFGTDMMGSKLDPTPTDRETERTATFIY
jgi:DNA repair exonuclease SbcCD ATPase subunit